MSEAYYWCAERDLAFSVIYSIVKTNKKGPLRWGSVRMKYFDRIQELKDKYGVEVQPSLFEEVMRDFPQDRKTGEITLPNVISAPKEAETLAAEIVSSDNVLKKILQAIAPTPKGVYPPSEDSFLMLNAISNISVEGKEVLDVGTGSGVSGLFCALRGASVTVIDIDETALLHVQKAAQSLGLRLNAVLSDLFSNVSGRFDLVLFNPPYLPSTTLRDRRGDGGRGGIEVTSRFLEMLPKHLKPEGSALLLLSNLNDPSSLIAQHPEFNFTVAAKRTFFSMFLATHPQYLRTSAPVEELEVLCLRYRENVAG